MKMTKEKIGFGLAAVLGLFLIGFSALGKLTGNAEVLDMFEKGGIEKWRIIIGIGEMVCAILFIIPNTKNLGAWLLSSYFGGAIMLHMTMGMSIVPPAAFLVLIWVVAILRGAKPVST